MDKKGFFIGFLKKVKRVFSKTPLLKEEFKMSAKIKIENGLLY